MGKEKDQNEFVKFPHTPHVKWLSEKPLREDKLMSREEVDYLFSGTVDVEEKIDGTNIGISFDRGAEIRVQRRGSYIWPPYKGEFSEFSDWLETRVDILFDHIGTRYIVFGEWCNLVHSIYYDNLPDYFIGFDIFDKEEGIFLSPPLRDEILHTVYISSPGRFYRGRAHVAFVEDLRKSVSSFYRSSGGPEGLYIRKWDDKTTSARGKIVSPEFVDEIAEHWREKETVVNKIT